jgi:hypothetical protein
MGYHGLVTVFGTPVRATDANIKAVQEITNPNPVSNVPEQPMWHVAPVIISGDVAFPLTTDGSVTDIFRKVLEKKNKSLEPGTIDIHWPPGRGGPFQSAFSRTFEGCVGNRLSVSGTAGQRVDVSLGILGIDFREEAQAADEQFSLGRVVDWSFVQISEFPGEDCVVKEFSVDINNNCSHNVTFSRPSQDSTFQVPRSISTGHREVTGTLTFLGSAPTQEIAKQNLILAASNQELNIEVNGLVVMKFNRVVYEWQDISISSGVVISKANWRAHGDGPGTVAAEFSFPS